MFKPARATLGSYAASIDATAADPAKTATPVSPWPYRLAWSVVFLCGMTVLGLAAWLQPNPSGTATHRQLGLPPCGLLEKTGYPCPSCGMTTAFAWAAHGRLDKAFVAQPAGTVLALLTACAVIVSAYLAVTGKDVSRILDDRLIIRGLIFLGIVVLAGWAYKIVAVIYHIG
jgi:hypothetical protein